MRRLFRSALVAAILCAAIPAVVLASVRAITGPTPIPRGAATSARDITVVNEKLAFATAVESHMPYGVPRGGIVSVQTPGGGGFGPVAARNPTAVAADLTDRRISNDAAMRVYGVTPR